MKIPDAVRFLRGLADSHEIRAKTLDPKETHLIGAERTEAYILNQIAELLQTCQVDKRELAKAVYWQSLKTAYHYGAESSVLAEYNHLLKGNPPVLTRVEFLCEKSRDILKSKGLLDELEVNTDVDNR